MLASLARWWNKPFDKDGSALDWVLFVGLIVIASFLWQLTLLEIARET